MKRPINKESEEIEQHIIFYTEEKWQEEKVKYNPSVAKIFSGKKNQVFVDTNEASLNFLIGLGNDVLPENELVEITLKFSNDYKKQIQPQATKIQGDFSNKKELKALLLGLYLGTYTINFDKKHPIWNEHFSWKQSYLAFNEFSEIQNEIFALCEGQFTAMDWLNRPANFKKVNHMNDFLKELAENKSLKYKSFNREECKKLGLGAFLSVNQGSNQEASFTILEYQSNKSNAKTIGLVGKCVLFDTGGISIKPSTNLHSEFIRGKEDRKWYFLETSSRVGGAHIPDLIEASTGINIWREWAKIETALIRNTTYKVPKSESLFAGLIIALAKEKHPNLDEFRNEELVKIIDMDYHVGLVYKSLDKNTIQKVLDDDTQKIIQNHLNILPATEKPCN